MMVQLLMSAVPATYTPLIVLSVNVQSLNDHGAKIVDGAVAAGEPPVIVIPRSPR